MLTFNKILFEECGNRIERRDSLQYQIGDIVGFRSLTAQNLNPAGFNFLDMKPPIVDEWWMEEFNFLICEKREVVNKSIMAGTDKTIYRYSSIYDIVKNDDPKILIKNVSIGFIERKE